MMVIKTHKYKQYIPYHVKILQFQKQYNHINDKLRLIHELWYTSHCIQQDTISGWQHSARYTQVFFIYRFTDPQSQIFHKLLVSMTITRNRQSFMYSVFYWILLRDHFLKITQFLSYKRLQKFLTKFLRH